MHIHRVLSDLQSRLDRCRDDLRIAEEQILFQMDVVEEARTRALVSQTPLADREHRTARDDLGRLERQRDRIVSEIADLRGEQDRLLDRMIEPVPEPPLRHG